MLKVKEDPMLNDMPSSTDKDFFYSFYSDFITNYFLSSCSALSNLL